MDAVVDRSREAVDVGANFGRYAMRLAGLVPRVWAFEPNPRLAYMLRRAMPGNVTVRNAAVSDWAGALTLSVPLLDGRPSEGVASVEPVSGASETHNVEAVTLDAVVGGRNVGFIKIDVEGHELNVLRGATALIEAERPALLVEVEERHRQGGVEEVFSFVRERGYDGVFASGGRVLRMEAFTPAMQSVSALTDGSARRRAAYVNNFIFIPAERLDDRAIRAIQDRLEAAEPTKV